MEKRNIRMQIKEMANFIMYVLIELVFSDSYMYFDLNVWNREANTMITFLQEIPGDGAKRMIVNP
jgi:hypothetical protein